MSDQKITQLPSITSAELANDDVIQVVDVSQPDATKNKKIRIDEIDKRFVTKSANPNVVNSVQAGANITVDVTDPKNPIVSSTGGGGGAVDSVNGQTGDVVLDADDIDDTSTTNKFVSVAEKNAIATIGSKVASVTAGANVTVDNTDPQNPIVSSTAAGGQVDSVVAGTGISVDNTDPVNPIISSTVTGDVESVNGQTGAVVLDADDIGETATREYVTPTQKIELNANSSTGVLSGGVMAVASSTTISITDGNGLVSGTQVFWSGLTNVTITNIGASTSSYILIDNTGSVVQQVSRPTQAQRRTHIFLGKAIHSDLATVTIVNNQQEVVSRPANQLNDFLRAFKLINLGNKIRKGAGLLNISKTSGPIVSAGANFGIDGNNNPHIRTLGPTNPTTFRYRTQSAEVSADVTNVDPTRYDNAGSLTVIAGSSSQATIQRIYLFPAGAVIVQYGQTVYANISTAIQNINNVGFVLENEIADNAILIGLLVITAGATDLGDVGQARFFDASIFGEQSVGAGGASVSTFQDVYGNSIKPQIQLDDGNGGIQIADNATPISDNLIEVLNNALNETYFAVNPTGVIAKSYGFTQNATASLNTGALENIEYTDAEGTKLLKKESGELYFTDFKNELPTDLFTENGGATIVNNTTTPLVGIREMQLTQSGANVGDGAEVILAIPSANVDWIKDFIRFSFLTKHNGSDGDFALVIEESDDNITYTSVLTTSINSAVGEKALRLKLKDTTEYVKIRAQIAVANDANVLTIARINITDKAFDVGEVSIAGEYYATNAVATRPSANSYSAQFSNVLINELNGLATVVNDGVSGVVLTALKDITGIAKSLIADNTVTMTYGFVKNGDTSVSFTNAVNDDKRYGSATNSPAGPNDTTQTPFTLKAGETLKLSTATNTNLYTGGINYLQNIQFLIQGSTDAVVSSDGDNTDVIVEGQGNGNTILTTGDNIDWIEVKDTLGSWSGTVFTAPRSDLFTFSGSVNFNSAAARTIISHVNGTAGRVVGRSSATESSIQFGATFYVEEGKTVSFRVNTGSQLDNNANNHWLDISSETKNNIVQVPIGGGGSWLPDTKILASTDGTTGTKASLSKYDLTVGKRYLVLPSIQFEETSATSGDHNYQVRFLHDSVTLDSEYGRAVTTSNYRSSYSNAFIFTATSTAIEFQVNALSLTTMLGDGTRAASYVQYIELPDEQRGAIVNQEDLQKYYATGTQIGYWGAKKLYAKSFTVATDTSSGVIGSLPAGAMPVGYPQHNLAGTSFRILQAIDPSSTTGVFINYTVSTGDLAVGGSGYHIGAGTSFTVKYTLD